MINKHCYQIVYHPPNTDQTVVESFEINLYNVRALRVFRGQ
jgi:hypothetical protein